MIRNKDHNQVPMMTGWVEGDGDVFETNTTAETFKTFALQEYGENAKEFMKIFPSSNDNEAKKSKRKLNLMNFASYSAYVLALENDNPTFLYQFSHVPTDKPDFQNYGAFQSSDIPYALHNLKLWDRPWQARDYEMEKIMNAYWLNFVKTGNPNGNGLPVWENYEIESGIIMEFNEGAFPRPEFFKAEFELMNKIYN